MAKVEVKRYATRLMHPRNTVLVTCVDKAGKPNIITLAWSMPTSHNPPMVAISVSPERYSHKLIRNLKEFVVNVPTDKLARESLFCGRRSGRYTRKFEEARLTPEKAKMVKPPIIKECIAHLECRVVNEVKTGDHTVFIGKVITAYADEHLFRNGRYNIKKVKILLHIGNDDFTTTTENLISPKLKSSNPYLGFHV